MNDVHRSVGSGTSSGVSATFTLLNPHVYLDTVPLVGSIGPRQRAVLRGRFVFGASSANLCRFGLIGLTMLVLSAMLARHAVNAT